MAVDWSGVADLPLRGCCPAVSWNSLTSLFVHGYYMTTHRVFCADGQMSHASSQHCIRSRAIYSPVFVMFYDALSYRFFVLSTDSFYVATSPMSAVFCTSTTWRHADIRCSGGGFPNEYTYTSDGVRGDVNKHHLVWQGKTFSCFSSVIGLLLARLHIL